MKGVISYVLGGVGGHWLHLHLFPPLMTNLRILSFLVVELLTSNLYHASVACSGSRLDKRCCSANQQDGTAAERTFFVPCSLPSLPSWPSLLRDAVVPVPAALYFGDWWFSFFNQVWVSQTHSVYPPSRPCSISGIRTQKGPSPISRHTRTETDNKYNEKRPSLSFMHAAPNSD